MTKKLIVLLIFLISLCTGPAAIADEDPPCAATLDLDDGVIEMPCVEGSVDGEELTGLLFHITLMQNGNSMNWRVQEVTDVTPEEIDEPVETTESAEASEAMAEESCDPVSVEINSGDIQVEIPCLIYADESYEVHMISQRGKSDNLELEVIKLDGEVLYGQNKQSKKAKKVKTKSEENEDEDDESEEEEEEEEEVEEVEE